MMFLLVLSFLINIFSGFSQGESASLIEEVHVVVFMHQQPVDLEEHKIKETHLEHVAYINSLKDQKKLLLAGAFEKGGEFLIFNKDVAIEEAQKLLEIDNALKLKLYRKEIYKADIRFGEVCESSVKEYIDYNFIRFISHITKYNVQHVPQLLKAHDDYKEEIVQTGNVLMESVFTNSDGGFMIMKGELSNKVIFNDPTVTAGFTIPEIKTIYIQKGSFCE